MFWGYVAYVALAVVSGAIVAAEMATYSTRRERLIQWSRAGNVSARRALIFLRAPHLYLAASQLAFSLAATIMGLISGGLFAQPLAQTFGRMGLAEKSAESAGFWTATIALTLLSTVFLNLLPKRFAYAYANEVAVATANVAWIWIKATGPLLTALNWTVSRIAKAAGLRQVGGSEVSEADVLTLLQEGRRDRTIDPDELELVKNALALSDIPIEQIATPRHKIEWLDLAQNVDAILRAAAATGHAFVPVGKQSPEHIHGYVRVRDVLAHGDRLTHSTLQSMVRPVARLPRTASILTALNMVRSSASRLALVCEDDGDIVGLVSLNDLVEAVLGELAPLDS